MYLLTAGTKMQSAGVRCEVQKCSCELRHLAPGVEMSAGLHFCICACVHMHNPAPGAEMSARGAEVRRTGK